MKTHWHPGVDLEVLKARARLLDSVRAFFKRRDVLEVQTPVLSEFTVTDPHIESIQCTSVADQPYLQTSPEFYMKRLLAAGTPAIFSLGPVFRAAELGRHHNVEFTMLEWYRPGFSLEELAQEVCSLVDCVLGEASYRRLSVEELFVDKYCLNPHKATREQLLKVCLAMPAHYERSSARFEPSMLNGLDEAQLFDLLFSAVQETLDGRVLVSDFPEQQAALSRVCENDSGIRVARRFELMIDGIEIANAYLELLDATELELRMQRDLELRWVQGKQLPEKDCHLLAAMQHGLPESSGVALGFDRLFMLQQGANNLAEVMPFFAAR